MKGPGFEEKWRGLAGSAGLGACLGGRGREQLDLDDFEARVDVER